MPIRKQLCSSPLDANKFDLFKHGEHEHETTRKGRKRIPEVLPTKIDEWLKLGLTTPQIRMVHMKCESLQSSFCSIQELRREGLPELQTKCLFNLVQRRKRTLGLGKMRLAEHPHQKALSEQRKLPKTAIKKPRKKAKEIAPAASKKPVIKVVLFTHNVLILLFLVVSPEPTNSTIPCDRMMPSASHQFTPTHIHEVFLLIYLKYAQR